MRKETVIFLGLLFVFLAAYFLPITDPKIQHAIIEGFKMLQWYARNHTLACVVPAMFIAGGIATFLSKEAVLRHLGPKANKIEAYSVASVSGTVLAVCSCSVLPMFAGIYRVGAGLGAASAFLYSGPAINIMAIFLTARVLGLRLGLARTIGAVVFSVVVGLLMAIIFRKDEDRRNAATMKLPDPPPASRALWQTVLYFASMIGFLIFSDWSNPSTTVIKKTDGAQFRASVLQETSGDYTVQAEETVGSIQTGTTFNLAKSEIASMTEETPENYLWAANIYHLRWYFAGACALGLLLILWRWFDREEISQWMDNTWIFAKQIVPLLFAGVLITGFVAALLPPEQVAKWVGGNSLQANFISFACRGHVVFCHAHRDPHLAGPKRPGHGRRAGLGTAACGAGAFGAEHRRDLLHHRLSQDYCICYPGDRVKHGCRHRIRNLL